MRLCRAAVIGQRCELCIGDVRLVAGGIESIDRVAGAQRRPTADHVEAARNEAIHGAVDHRDIFVGVVSNDAAADFRPGNSITTARDPATVSRGRRIVGERTRLDHRQAINIE